MRQRRYNQDGFTLIEIMVVIAIIGLMALLIVPRFRGVTNQAKRTKAMSDIQTLEAQLDRYYLDNGTYPTTDQGLRALVAPPTSGRVPSNYSSDGYINKLPNDPWGIPYYYESDGNNYVLKSFGPDGVDSSDDINSSNS